jgi:uncharacterized protein
MTDTQTTKVNTNIYQFQIFEAGAIVPKGWIKEQLERDLTEGFIGHYDKVNKTVAHNLFVEQNRLSKIHYFFRKEWWSGEHEGYWKDAVIRMAYLTGNKQYMEMGRDWMMDIINNTGKDGYIGIYREGDKPNCRFHHIRGNGELWATSRILMAMLAYYEFTKDQRVLKSAENAAQLVMDQYGGTNYFLKTSKGGGVSHGIGFFENLEWLFRLTGKRAYLDFALKLYGDFNEGPIRDDDLKTHNLLDAGLFRKHGAHIAEGLFVPEFIAAISGKPGHKKAAKKVYFKLEKHLTPGGAMRCDEWIKGRKGTADERYEYCGIAEMISPMNRMVAISGNFSLADRIETMAFNAGQGARLPTLSALSYLTADNRIRINHNEIARREHYDASHIAAACCALNGGRLMPYFVEGMWMKSNKDNGLVAVLFGPCELNTEVKGKKVTISEETSYPFSNDITFTIKPSSEVLFPLHIRKPHGCQNIRTELPKGAQIEEKDHEWVITCQWNNISQVKVKFEFDIKKMHQPASKTVKNKGVFLRHGALVYALPFNHKINTVKEYNKSGFYRYKIKPRDTKGWEYKIKKEDNFQYKANGKNLGQYPWDQPVVGLKGHLHDTENNKQQEVELVPMGNTIFRRVTFPEIQ